MLVIDVRDRDSCRMQFVVAKLHDVLDTKQCYLKRIKPRKRYCSLGSLLSACSEITVYSRVILHLITLLIFCCRLLYVGNTTVGTSS